MTAFSRLAVLPAVAIAATLALTGCAVEMQNTQAAQELKHQAQPPGSAYSGWRVFQDKCARCHGPAATGLANAPDLLPRVREMGPRQFVSLVLKRYDWGLSATQAAGAGTAWDATVDDTMLRKHGMLNMPAWGGEPEVTAHVTDLYAYLSARARGEQGSGRPAP